MCFIKKGDNAPMHPLLLAEKRTVNTHLPLLHVDPQIQVVPDMYHSGEGLEFSTPGLLTEWDGRTRVMWQLAFCLTQMNVPPWEGVSTDVGRGGSNVQSGH